MKRILTAIAVSVCSLGLAAQAQQQSGNPYQVGPAGQWQCQTSFTEMNQRGQRTSGFTQQFVMNVQQNGQFFAQGMMNAVPYPTQIRVQGQWRVQDGVFGAQGMMPTEMGQMPWMVAGQLQGNTIQMNQEAPSQYTRGGKARSIVMCQKAG